ISKQKSELSRHVTKATLHKLFPEHFEDVGGADSKLGYIEDQISELFQYEPDLVRKLSRKDVKTLADFYPLFFKRYSELNPASTRLLIAGRSKQATEQIYLEEAVAEFTKRLARSVQKEADWQSFLRKYILLFNTNYVRVLENLSITFLGKY